jgi:archaellum biogenesis ATPase FlaH
MDLMLNQDIRRILLDMEKARSGLERLKRDYVAWDREREEKDLVRLIQQARRLEIDLSLILSDCMSPRRSSEEADPDISQDLHQVFVALNRLFSNLKNVRLELSQAYIHPDTLKHLEVLCDRFAKKIEKIQEDLQGEKKRLELFPMRGMFNGSSPSILATARDTPPSRGVRSEE